MNLEEKLRGMDELDILITGVQLRKTYIAGLQFESFKERYEFSLDTARTIQKAHPRTVTWKRIRRIYENNKAKYCADSTNRTTS